MMKLADCWNYANKIQALPLACTVLFVSASVFIQLDQSLVSRIKGKNKFQLPPIQLEDRQCYTVFPRDPSKLDPNDFKNLSQLELFLPNQSTHSNIHSIYSKRRHLLARQCNSKINRSKTRKVSTSRLALFPRLDILYCAIAKCANTAWSAILENLERDQIPVMPRGAKGLVGNVYAMGDKIKYAESLKSNVLNRLIVVRHPVTRLLSGFKDIVVSGHHPEQDINIVRSVSRKAGNKTSLQLEVYMNQILKSENRHFWSYKRSCFPCELNFNLIVKVDDQNETSDFFLESGYVSAETANLYRKAGTTRANEAKKNSSSWKPFFEDVSAQSWIRFLEHYRVDFELFGYEIFRCIP